LNGVLSYHIPGIGKGLMESAPDLMDLVHKMAMDASVQAADFAEFVMRFAFEAGQKLFE